MPGVHAIGLFAIFSLSVACQSPVEPVPDEPDESGELGELSQEVQSGANYTFAAGSLVIPMDITYQNNGMFKAYGLAYRLLQSNVPISWVIKPGKTLCQVSDPATCAAQTSAADFTVTAMDFVTNAAITPTHAYRGGPFVIDQPNAAAAGPIITAWNAALVADKVTVHRTTAPFTGYIKRQMVAAPTIAMFQDGFEAVAVKYLTAAGIPDSTGDYNWPATSPDLLTPTEVAGPSCPTTPVSLAGSPAGATQTGNVATYTTTVAHGLAVGNIVEVAGVAGYSGQLTVTGVPSPTTFTAVLRATGLAPSGGGTVTKSCASTPHNDGALFNGTGTPAYCQMMSMHYGVGDADTVIGREVIREYRQFLQSPVHLFGECQAVNAIENNTDAGFALAAAPAGATQSGTTATFTTTTSHPFYIGEHVLVGGVGGLGYNRTWVVTSVPTPLTFTAVSSAQPPVSGLAASGGGTVKRYNGLFLTNAGYLIDDRPITPVKLFNSGEPFTQFDGAFATVGGSERSYTLPPGESYKAEDIVFITQGPGTGFRDLWMTGYLDGSCSILNEFCDPQFAQGKVSYLGGHEYNVTTPISANGASQGTRLFLNALLEAPCATDLGAASVSLNKSAPTSSTSSMVSYTITAFNNGSAAAAGLVITDTLPAGVSFVPPSVPATISAIARATNVVTATTTGAHGFQVGDRVTVAGVTNATFNGTFTVTQVVSATQLRYAQTGADASSTGGTLRRARDGVCVGTAAQCGGAGGGVVTFDLGALAAGQSTSVTINVQYGTPAVYANTAQATYRAGATTLTATSNTTTTCYYAGNPSICSTGCDANAPACANGCDDDADGKIDFPDDAGCAAATDTTEQDFTPAGPVKSRVLVVFDTSGSMMWNTCRDEFTGGDGSIACPGADVACSPSPPGCGTLGCGNGIADDARLAKVKSGISNVVNGFGEVEWGLMRFHQLPTQFSCGTLNVNKNDGGWQGAGASPCTGFDSGDVVVKFDPENINSMLSWMDGSSNYPGTPPPGKDFELRASGNTPLGGSLASARTYIAQTRSTDDPLVSSCRPYRVILVTDGAETCGGDPVSQAGSLFGQSDSDGRVPVHVIGFSTPNASTQLQLNQIAAAGGTTSFIPADNDQQLSAAIESIVEDSILKELCNNLDDDCDTKIDEDFPDKGAVCDNGAKGTCRRAGVRVCTSDATGTTCNALSVTCVGGRLIDGNGNDLGPCTEVCNNQDDDCDGKVDEAPAMNCQPCVPTGEACNNADDDCDGKVDESLTRQCGTGTCLGTETCMAGTYNGCTAQVPTTETCNGLDDDCDGLRDGLTVDCSDIVVMGGPGTDNPGHPSNTPIPQNICKPGEKTCPVNVGPPNAFSSCSGEVKPCNGFTPCTDPCNGLDDDCDNLIDEDFVPADCSTNCGVGQTVCVGGQLSCNAVPAMIDDTCNNLDDDCDGMFDEDFAGAGMCGTGTVCNGAEECVNGQVVCVGDPIGVETCNCTDDNCNGQVDEGALCPGGATCTNCQCAYPCGPGEFPCPLGKKCTSGFCVADPCFNVNCPPVNGNHQSCVDQGNNMHACVDTCTLTSCSAPLICYGPTGECKPDNCTTFPERCSATQTCVNGTCVANPCADVTCGSGQYCVNGTCVGSCSGVTCPDGQRCKLGACEADPCGQPCPGGQVCNDTTGSCVADPCRFVNCPQGQWCNPNAGGQCQEDPCVGSGVMCPGPGEVCRGGTCYTPMAQPDAGTDEYVTTGGGGGCAAGGDAGWLLGLALLGLARRKRAARFARVARVASRLAAVGLLALVTTSLSCSINEYCLECAQRSDGGGTGGGDDASTTDDGGTDPDASPCVPSGMEVCDGMDNDCNGQVDDGTLVGVGVPCTNQMGECAGGTQQCTNGALRCSKPPMPEICDLKDNNCNGQVDEGDPGGGAVCGTNLGECVAGVSHCNPATGMVECYGSQDHTSDPELCNGKDDDCDGKFDEGVGVLGTCGPTTNVGECNIGSLMCQAGSVVCMNAVFPAFEACNAKDDDCDGQADEIYNFASDPLHCGNCTTVCPPHANSIALCANSACTFACKAGFHDLNPAVDGCEYGPCFSSGAEQCDGTDNDCDGIVDESLTPPAICLQGGACGNAVPTCMGANGWRCNYPAEVQTDANGNVIPETKCDNVDNDCDTRIDEGQPNLTQACSDGQIGVCRSSGVFACNPSDLNGPAVCMITQPGQQPGVEACNGKDDDCDGTIDDGAPDSMVEVRNASNTLLFKIYAYEASRPDATAGAAGVMSHRSCSSPSVVPWSTVTQAQAAAACAASGKRLCTATEWQLACAGNSGRKYPYGNTYQPNTCNGNDYDPNCTLPDDDLAQITGAKHGCPAKPAQSACASSFGAFDMSGNLKEWTATATATNTFQVRGGGFDSAPGGLACDFGFVSMDKSFAFPNLGFRCCQDP
jgi:uncharacterized repeat protein (TIGR01451 family)